jgi:TolA-binding protein
MKAQQRHQLKQNDFVATMARVMAVVTEHRDRLVLGGAVALLALAIGGGYFWWRQHTNDQAGALFGTAMAITEAPIAPPPTVPGAHQAPGTYPADRARQEAALQAFERVASTYPATDAGLAAKYHIGAALLALGRFGEAELAFQDVTAGGGTSLYTSASRMGLAETFAAENQYDKAIKAYTDLAAQRDGGLPVDGVLMQLARVCLKAGKTEDARAAFTRIVNEFPDSSFVAQAKQQLALLS